MDIKRITVPLSMEEEKLLKVEASKACRRPRDHARYIILNSLGLMTDEGMKANSAGVRQDLASTVLA